MEILKYIIPALLVLLAVYLLLYHFFKNENERRNTELKKANIPVVVPTRLRAYERLALLLERVNPNNMVIGKLEQSSTCLELQTHLLVDIRKEFEHNASQQIYVSRELWDEINEARENLIQLVNTCAMQCKPDEPANKLATIIVEVFNAPEETALDGALLSLKEDVKELF